jgi:hypothetical protein
MNLVWFLWSKNSVFAYGSHPYFILCLVCVSSIPEVFVRHRQRFLVHYSDLSSRAPDFVFAGFGFLDAFLRSMLLIFPASFFHSRPCPRGMAPVSAVC